MGPTAQMMDDYERGIADEQDEYYREGEDENNQQSKFTE